MKKIGIIIINYKDYAEKFLEDCIESLRGQQAPGFLWQLYIIDNCSEKKYLEEIKKHVPQSVIIPRSDGNYSAANKKGIEKAKEDGCDYFVITNMDVIFEKDWLHELVKTIESDNKIGIAQSKVLLHKKNDKKIINSVGNVLHFLGFGFTKGYREEDNGQYDQNTEISGYASGCSLIIKKEVIDKIGNYDPQYYMYHDDIELSWRTKLAGYKIVLAPKSIMYHKYEFNRSVRMLYYMERNRYIVMFSFYKIPTIILILPPLIIMEMGMFFYAIAGGWFITKLRVYYYFLKPQAWNHIFKVRRQVRKFRKAKDKDIVKNIAGKVEYQEIMNPILKYLVNPIFDAYWNLVKKLIIW